MTNPDSTIKAFALGDTPSGPQPLRCDSSGRLMWTPESRPMITQELADAFEAGIEFYIKFTGPSVVGGVVTEKPDGTLDWRPIAEGWAKRRAGVMTS